MCGKGREFQTVQGSFTAHALIDLPECWRHGRSFGGDGRLPPGLKASLSRYS